MNKPLDRDYFKKKANPKAKKGPQLTVCCGQSLDRHILNKNNKDDWELIEDYCEEQLRIFLLLKILLLCAVKFVVD